MTRKKIFAFLSALTMAASMAALPASACFLDTMTYIDGVPYNLTSMSFDGIIVETDGTELTMEMLSDKGVISDIQVFDETFRLPVWGVQTFDFTTDETAFTVYVDTNTTEEERIALARSLMMEFDYIKDAYSVSITTQQQLSFENAFYLTFNDAATVISAENYPELADLEIGEATYNESEEYYACWVNFTDQYYAMTEEGMAKWEIHQHYCNLTDTLNEKYGDALTAHEPFVALSESAGSHNGTVSSVWTDAGDSNSDGTVDSTDAAEMLMAAAQIGTGADVAVTSAADVNADGALNAVDAAAVLSYAAVKGTGAEPSWVDILRK